MTTLSKEVGRFTLPRVQAAWYILCHAHELRNKPIRRQLFGRPIVLFRDASKQPAALLDRCAHRNVPLSLGRVREGMLQCGYHGWCFDRDGVCRAVPTLCDDAHGKGRRVVRHAVRQADGFVWVWGEADVTPSSAPSKVAEPGGGCAVRYSYRFAASLLATIENILDVPHTAFLHRGLFRSAGPGNALTVTVRLGASWVEADYAGEPVPRGLLGRVLAPRGGQVTHVDRFELPSVAQVRYSLGDHAVVVRNMLTPVDDFVTDMFTVVSVRLPLAQLIAAVLGPVARHVARQDAQMLQAQTAALQAFGREQFVSTDVDVLGVHIVRLLRQAERGEVASEAGNIEDAGGRVVDTLSMRV